ncbi:MAG: nitrogen fixation negative regulator NifL [Candidatus Dactylopiibacterium carminicum]|uniref:histidine kinase n=1 Tax=Candidatus Dactylopiibacterium carminicum TaxID=857335 RepID=A0A272EY66_9RHOO|nr:nitrogen fixation negative regulator NifL [Candidatus Dactylopiibacterium carminicum]KAF7600430.1 nitrogen fixation negative regulator NifL [Candidatus Dactylopiibacterium carminicum]PAS95051.1 MAG: nitrogen fixation negative regulator NifL [Candidatus Dactylopiibacterium carminicum]PAT00429.1 MAG: nitrogen fixation negative regulator NifL [Candidatus Dactylopiibacterium carminicum]
MTSTKPSARVAPLSADLLASSLFRAAVEQADIAISITDARAVIEYVNPAFTRTTGYSAAEAVGRNQSILSNKTTPPDVYQAMWRQITACETWHGRLVNCRRDGSRYLADLTVTPVLDETGGISHFLGLHRDVTELHGLECAVRNQKALIESVVDSAPLVMALLSLEDRVALDNQAYKALMADLGMQEPAPVLLEAVRDQLGSGFGPFRPGAYAFVEQQVRLDCPLWHSPRWYACSGVWVAADRSDADAFYEARSEPYLLLVANDVTRQTVEQEKARVAALQAVMTEEVRQQSLRESLAAAAYQIEGPLNVIDSVVTLMGRRGCDPAQAALTEALRAGQAAVEALKSALPPPPPQRSTSVNLNEVVRDVLDLSAYACLNAGVTVTWQPQLVLLMLTGAPTRLRILLKALVDNAIEAMNTKGWRQRELTITSRTSDGSIVIDVADSGPGLDTTLRLRAFEPFFTTKKGRGQHLGTGLASAQQIAVEHGGGIELLEAPGGGCLARVSLPLRRQA